MAVIKKKIRLLRVLFLGAIALVFLSGGKGINKDLNLTKEARADAPSSSPSSNPCFVRGTQILLADGSEKKIEDIQVGDIVRGAEGARNKVLELVVHELGDRIFYSFNEKDPFVTSGHPFLTKDGWKSVDPSATPQEKHNVSVQKLTVGDALVTAKGEEVLKIINEHTALSNTPVYDLSLNGDHTYFANSFLVHNKCCGCSSCP